MKTIRRYLQFCIVGGSGLIVDMGFLWLLTSPFVGWNLTLSKVCAAEIAILNNFLWNDLWTFRDAKVSRRVGRDAFIRFFRFNLICVFGIGLSVVLLNTQVYVLGINVYVANFFSIVAVSVWNFLMNLRFGWGVGNGVPPSRTAKSAPSVPVPETRA